MQSLLTRPVHAKAAATLLNAKAAATLLYLRLSVPFGTMLAVPVASTLGRGGAKDLQIPAVVQHSFLLAVQHHAMTSHLN
jgi:hypothetical protein